MVTSKSSTRYDSLPHPAYSTSYSTQSSSQGQPAAWSSDNSQLQDISMADTTNDTLTDGEGDNSASPPAFTNGERPRVRADGPGGADIKRGARIACLECRSAKIKCSAPNDGQVPCKRCSRHDKECVFEKHRRGRKPGRGNLPKVKPTATQDGSAASPSSSSSRVASGSAPATQTRGSNEQLQQQQLHHHHHHQQQPFGISGTSPRDPYQPGGAWSPSSLAGHTLPAPLPSPSLYMGKISPGMSGYGRTDYGFPVSSSTPSSRPSPSSRAPHNGGAYNGSPMAPPPPFQQMNQPYQQGPQGGRPDGSRQVSSSGYPGSLPLFPERTSAAWSHRPLPPSPFEMPGSNMMGSHHAYPGPSTSSHSTQQHGFFSPPVQRAEVNAFAGMVPPVAAPRKEDSRWSQTTARTQSPQSQQPQRSAGSAESPKRQKQQHTPSMGPPMQPPRHAAATDGTAGSNSKRIVSLSAVPSRLGAPTASAKAGDGEEEEDEEEADELVDEDEVIGAYQDPDILSRPLQLLAYASTAAARRQVAGGYRDPRSMAAAATLGLISSPASKTKLKDIKEAVLAKSNTSSTTASTTAANPAASQTSQKMASVGVQGGGGAEACTLENGDWEYKAGRLQAVKAGEASQSPVSIGKGSDESVPVVPLPAVIEEALEAEAAGPHLRKRRRSDDELLPTPRSRRESTVAQFKSGGAMTAAAPAISQQANDTALDEDIVNEDDQPVVASGASRKGYFRFSIYSSKLDVDDAVDPITMDLVSLKEMQNLFDFFFNNVNPSNFIFDPFLHSLAYVRTRSKFLLTVIGAQAARMSEGDNNSVLAERLEQHWRVKLLPEILSGGYKSAEISQAFLLASLFHRPTHIIVEDRAWQYLGFAIRTATEVGVNISLAPDMQLQDNEHLTRRLRNRERLWLSLVIAEGTLSAQFGRPCTLSPKDSVTQSSYWNREDYALPEDAALICQLALGRIVEHYTRELEKHMLPTTISSSTSTPSSEAGESSRLAQLMATHQSAWRELEKWKNIWCPIGMDQAGVGGSMAMGAFLVRWSPYSRLIYYYWRCHLNSFVLQATAGSSPSKKEDLSSAVSFDSMKCSRELIAILLDESQIGASGLALAPNAVVVMSTYAAVSALRLTKLDLSKHAFIDQRSVFEHVHKLAETLETAGSTPDHRDGAAGPYGTYLRSVLALFDNDSKSSSSVASEQAGGVHRSTRDRADSTPLRKKPTTAAAVNTLHQAMSSDGASTSMNAFALHNASSPSLTGISAGRLMTTTQQDLANENALAEALASTAEVDALLGGSGNGNSTTTSKNGSLNANAFATAMASSASSGGPHPNQLSAALAAAAMSSGTSAPGTTINTATSSPISMRTTNHNHHHHLQHNALDDLALSDVYPNHSVWGYLPSSSSEEHSASPHPHNPSGGGGASGAMGNASALWPGNSTTWSGL